VYRLDGLPKGYTVAVKHGSVDLHIKATIYTVAVLDGSRLQQMGSGPNIKKSDLIIIIKHCYMLMEMVLKVQIRVIEVNYNLSGIIE
jgi:Ni2+-binding GTPase involved in maturation of urease and hydrogenase